MQIFHVWRRFFPMGYEQKKINLFCFYREIRSKREDYVFFQDVDEYIYCFNIFYISLNASCTKVG